MPRLSTGLETVAKDVAYAWRSLCKSPGFAAVTILSLGLGIGAITTVLCWTQNILWRPLPGVERQNEIVVLVSNQGGGNVSLPDLRDFGLLEPVFTGAAASQITPASISIGKHREWIYGQITTANFFDVLGVKPISGGRSCPTRTRSPAGIRSSSSAKATGVGVSTATAPWSAESWT